MKQLPVSSRGNEAGNKPCPRPLHRLPAISRDISISPQAAPYALGWSCHGTGQHSPYIFLMGRARTEDEGKLCVARSALSLETASWQEQKGQAMGRVGGDDLTPSIPSAQLWGYRLCAGPLLRAAVLCTSFPPFSGLWTRTEADCFQLVLASLCPTTLLGTL